MAKYKKRADGRYSTTVTVNISGEKKKKYVYGRTIKEVDDKIAELRAQDMRGSLTDDKHITVGEWAETWFRRYKSQLEHNTQSMYLNAINKHIIPRLGQLQLTAVTLGTVQDLINLYREHPRTAEVIRLTLRQMFDAAVAERLIALNPCSCLEVKRKTWKEKRVLTDAELERIFSADLSPKQRAFLNTLLYTGIRRGEALALTSDDIDFDRHRLTVNKTVIYVNGKAEIKHTPKSAAGVRTIPMPGELCDLLSQLPPGIIFPMQTKYDYMTHSAYVKFWKSIQKACGLPDDVTAHSLRHTYATKLYHSNVDVKTAQYLMGHSSVNVTLNIYTHLQALEANTNLADKLTNLY